MKKIILGFLSLILIFYLSSCDTKTEDITLPDNYLESEEIKNCEHFIRNKLMNSDGGIYTNYNENQENEMARGHEILSESMGLFLLYEHYTKRHEGFDYILRYIQEKFLFADGLYLWKIDGEKTDVNATLDDLRIAKAIFLENAVKKDKEKENILKDIADAIYEKCTNNDILVNFYEKSSNSNSDIINLSYIDIKALHYLSLYNQEIEKIIAKNYEVIKKGYISDEFPLYYKEYNTKTGEYIKEGEINTIEVLITFLHLAQIDRLKIESEKWIIDNFNNNSIYASYDLKTKKGLISFESTAIYALLSQIFIELNYKALYNESIDKMLKLQVKDESSQIFGAFGEKSRLEVYSFDNLNALIALIQYEGKVN